jgi:hypothetical protein
MVKAWPDLLFANISPVVERSRDHPIPGYDSVSKDGSKFTY